MTRRMTNKGQGIASIEDRLSAEAERARAAPPPGLRHRTLAAVAESARRAVPAPARRGSPRRGRWAWPAGLAAVAAIAIFVIAGMPRGRPQVEPPPPRPQSTARVITLIDPARITAALSRRAGAVEAASESRLLAEAGLVASDLRRIGVHMMANLPMPQLAADQR